MHRDQPAGFASMETADQRAWLLLAQLRDELPEAKQEHGWQSEIARLLGVHQSTVNKTFKGDRGGGAIQRAAVKALGLSMDFFSERVRGEPSYRDFLGGPRHETRVEREDGRGEAGTAALEEYLAELAASDDPASPELAARARRIYLSGGVDSRPMAVRALGYARAALAEEVSARAGGGAPVRATTSLTDEDRSRGMRTVGEAKVERAARNEKPTPSRLGKPKPRAR